jgi:hypothetical protein
MPDRDGDTDDDQDTGEHDACRRSLVLQDSSRNQRDDGDEHEALGCDLRGNRAERAIPGDERQPGRHNAVECDGPGKNRQLSPVKPTLQQQRRNDDDDA